MNAYGNMCLSSTSLNLSTRFHSLLCSLSLLVGPYEKRKKNTHTHAENHFMVIKRKAYREHYLDT